MHPTPASLVVQLLGPFDVRVNGAPLPRLRSRKVYGLLALLALHHDRQLERGWLAGTLWPESGERQAFASLRDGLKDLRRALGPTAGRVLSPTPRTLALPLAPTEADIVAFDAALVRGDRPSLEEAVALYRGPLLDGWAEEWLLPERQAREEAYLRALERLAADATARREYSEAARYLRRVVSADPLREGAQRALMQTLAADGNYAAVTQTYRDLRLLLHHELNTEPAPETTALFHQLRAEAQTRALDSHRMRSTGRPGTGDRPRGVPGRQSVPRNEESPGLSGAGDRAAPAGPPPSRIPRPLTGLVGRRQEVEETRNALFGARLVTLTGTGGVGKTRLAIQVAEESVEQYADGVGFVDLAPLSDPALVPAAVLSRLEIPEQPARSWLEALMAYLRPKQLLLVLDNCEHLLDACARSAEVLLRECPRLQILTTSRQTLGLLGETSLRVPSLPVPEAAPGAAPPEGPIPSREEWMQYDAVRLFVERARAGNPDFTLTSRNAPAVVAICQRLDGIPLAIELAAARVRTLPVETIHERLHDRFGLLKGGIRTGLPRHQTLKALIDWSYDLLSAAERTLFQRLSVFAGGWTLEAAEVVCADPVGSPTGSLRPTDILVLLTSLVDQSLVAYEDPAGTARYRMLETVRQYARDHLLEAGEVAAVQERHRDWFLALAEQAEAGLVGGSQTVWLERLEREHDNLRAALAWSAAAGQGEAGLRLGGALGPFWAMRSYLGEGSAHLTRLLALPGAEARTAARAKALRAAGPLIHHQGDNETARALFRESLAICQGLGDKPGIAWSLLHLGLLSHETRRAHFEQSLALFREVGDKRGIASVLPHLGGLAQSQGEYGAAAELLKESIELFGEIGNKYGIASSLIQLGWITHDQGKYSAARTFCERSLAICQELGNKEGIALSFLRLGIETNALGEHKEARALLEKGLVIYQEVGNKYGIAHALACMGVVAHDQGEDEQARVHWEKGLALFREVEERGGIMYTVERLAVVAMAQGQAERAARLFGAAECRRGGKRAGVSPTERAEYDRSLTAVRTALGEEAFAAAWDAGQALTLDEAVCLALEEKHRE